MSKYHEKDDLVAKEIEDRAVYTTRKLAKVFMQLGVPRGALNLGYFTEPEKAEFIKLMDEYEASVRYINQQ
jgi:hypothetical protein